jgi:multiple sugar transport system ATP-binding protein
MVAISMRSLGKTFDGGVVAVDDFDLDVSPGEFLVLVGPSGSGKSTVLRMIAGLEPPTAGEVLFDGVPVTDIAPADRNVAILFSSYKLYPHLTVAQNIGFPLRAGKHKAADIPGRIAEVAASLGIADLLSRTPEHLSGGQQQRVAMARAIIKRPAVLLLDEPLSNVDVRIREEVRADVAALTRRLALTTVYVTHDQGEALSLGDRMALMRRGRLQQVGPPAQVYDDPGTVFVAGFLGTPRTILLQGAIYAGDGSVVLDLGDQALPLPAELADRHTERVTVAVRALRPGGQLRGVVRTVRQIGVDVVAQVDIGGVPSLAEPELPPMEETGVYARIPVADKPVAGDQITLGVQPGDLFLFDRAGRRIPWN